MPAPEIGRLLDLNELGPWYAGALAVIALMINSNKSTGPSKVVQGFVPPDSPAMQAIEKQLEELTETTAAIQAELNELQGEKFVRDQELKVMQAELAEMRTELQQTKIREEQLELELSRSKKVSMEQALQLKEVKAEKVCLC